MRSALAIGLASAAMALSSMLYLPSAAATTVTICGPTVCYDYNDAQAAIGFYGTPTLAGDDVVFTPGDPNPFRAESVQGDALHNPTPGISLDVISSTFVFSRVYTINPLREIVSITASEDGDYRINTAGAVTADLFLQATSLNPPAQSTTGTDSFASSGPSGGLQLWSMSATVNPSASFTAFANNMSLSIQNDLSADSTTAVGSRAWIEKKLVLNTTVTNLVSTVPVPAAAWLFAPALGLVGSLRRRRPATS